MTSLALLRGINVGGNHRVPMADLRASFETAGLSNVRTYINSGNVLFDAPTDLSSAKLSADFETRLPAEFGFPIPVLVVAGSDLAAVAAAIPAEWANDDAQKCDVVFLFPELHRPDVLNEFDIVAGVDEAHYSSGAVLWRVLRRNQTLTGLQSLVGSPLYRRCTVRNVNTVRKLAALAAARELPRPAPAVTSVRSRPQEHQ